MASPALVRTSMLIGTAWALFGCSQVVYSPAPVVPTKRPLPYTATLALDHIGGYMVKPGATMVADPSLANHVTGLSDALGSARSQWEQAVLRYMEARRTFARVSTTGPADIALVMHLNVYIDPGVLFQYRHAYVARADASVTDPRTHRVLLSYSGYGKAFGEVRRDGHTDDQDPINHAVQMALNDLFGKMEQDGRMRQLGRL